MCVIDITFNQRGPCTVRQRRVNERNTLKKRNTAEDTLMISTGKPAVEIAGKLMNGNFGKLGYINICKREFQH